MSYHNILLIDDDDEDQEIFLTAIEEVDCEVKCMALSDATDALQKLVDKDIEPDLIFLDLNMPVMNGQQFLREIKGKEGLKTIPIIIISTSTHTPTIKLTKELGASEFITKPSKFDELVNILTPLIC